MEPQEASIAPPIYVHSKHPLVYQLIERTLATERYRVKPFSMIQLHCADECEWVLIVDTYSVQEWLETALRSGSLRKRPVIILADNPNTCEEEIRLLYLGVRGIVPSTSLESDLAPAVNSVTAGHMWLRPSTLNEYFRRVRASGGLFKLKFTVREEQVIALLLEGFANKEISHLLGISNRTVKFHVSNVFNKLNVRNRKDLLRIMRPCERPALIHSAT